MMRGPRTEPWGIPQEKFNQKRTERFGRMCYESRGFYISEKRVSVYRVEPAKGVNGWRGKWCRVNRQFGKNREVIRWRAVGGRE